MYSDPRFESLKPYIRYYLKDDEDMFQTDDGLWYGVVIDKYYGELVIGYVEYDDYYLGFNRPEFASVDGLFTARTLIYLNIDCDDIRGYINYRKKIRLNEFLDGK